MGGYHVTPLGLWDQLSLAGGGSSRRVTSRGGRGLLLSTKLPALRALPDQRFPRVTGDSDLVSCRGQESDRPSILIFLLEREALRERAEVTDFCEVASLEAQLVKALPAMWETSV